MVPKKIRIEWSLADVLKDKGIIAGQFIEDVQKIDSSYTDFSLKRLMRANIRRINLDLLGIIVSLLDCEIEDLLYYGTQKPADIFFKGDIFSLVSRSSTEEYFPVEITEEETEAFPFLRSQKVGSAKNHVGTSVAVSDVIELLEARTTERSTYITNFFKVLKNKYLPVREDKASARFMCFLRISTAAEGYVSLMIMSTRAVSLLTKHSLVTLDLLKNFTTFRNRKQVVTPWFEIETLKQVYGFNEYDTQDFKKFVLTKSIIDIQKNMGIVIQYEFQSRQNRHLRFLVD